MHDCNRRRDARVQGRKVKELKSAGMQECRKARSQKCKSAWKLCKGTQECRKARAKIMKDCREAIV
jgi:hypothetical protein